MVAIRSLFDYIAAREPLLLDHCHKIATIPRKRGAALPVIHYLEKEEITAILDAAANDPAPGARDYILLLFMYNTGARVQEVADTRLSWLSLNQPYKVELLGKGRKWRTCPLWENTVKHLRHLIEHRRLTEPNCLPVCQSLRPATQSFWNRGHPGTCGRAGVAKNAKFARPKRDAAHAAPHDRHALAPIWRRNQRDPLLARPRELGDNKSLRRNRSGDESQGSENVRSGEAGCARGELAIQSRHLELARIALKRDERD
jgi:integrase